MSELEITKNISIPESEFTWTFSRSSGPGGQNVNKVNSRATLRWNLQSSVIPIDVKIRFKDSFGSRLTKDGDLLISSDVYRDQQRNVGECIEKLSEMLRLVAIPPKKRKPTKPTKGAKRRRLDEKKSVGQKKTLRKKVGYYD